MTQLQALVAGVTPTSLPRGAQTPTTPTPTAQGGFFGPLLDWLDTFSAEFTFTTTGIALVTAGIAIMALSSKPVRQFVGDAVKEAGKGAATAAVVAE